MPKRKNAPKAPPTSVEDRRERSERVVHREEMSATVGDVLEALHTDSAIELLYAQDNLAAGRDLSDPTALYGVAVTATDNAVAAASPAISEVVAAVGVVKAAATTIADTVSAAASVSKAVGSEVEAVSAAASQRAHAENASEAEAEKRVPRSWEPTTPLSTKPSSMLRFLSPRFVIKATREAVGELVSGVRHARSELVDAGVRARRCFGGTVERVAEEQLHNRAV